MHRYFLLMVAACFLLLPGCRTPQTVKDAWKGTRSYYYEYLNTPAKLDMDDKGNVLDYQAALGFAVSGFDMQLQELERALQNSDQNPDAAWVSGMTVRFPWLSGVALTDEDGIPRAKIPPSFPKPFEIGNLLEVDPKQQLKELRAFVQNDLLGPEVYVGNPVYIGADFRGVIIAHFDPRGLLARTGDAAQVMIAGPDGILWSGMYDAEATPIAAVNWAERVKDDVYGIETNELGSFYWICRYIGNLPLIYAIRIQGEFPIREENMNDLVTANSFSIGPIDLSMLQAAPPEEEMPQQGMLQNMPEEGMGTSTPPQEISPDGQNSPLTEPAPTQDAYEQNTTPLAE